MAQIGNAASVGIGRQAIREPLNLESNLLPQVFTYTRAQPGGSKTPGGTPITFDYNGQHWTSDQNGWKVGQRGTTRGLYFQVLSP